jgi:hypothetical protein
MRKPLPKDYGFENESEVRLAIDEEDRRSSKVRNAGIITFLAVFIVSATALILVSRHEFTAIIVTGRILGVALICMLPALASSLAARFLTEALRRPSDKYLRARQYSIANRMWIQHLQREYGYES